ncbi:MAG TPA: hypothetical protein VFL31_04815 [Nitrospiraceae bacterium]|nr:hypothetical protein [Nitrospiraceae bacterium]
MGAKHRALARKDVMLTLFYLSLCLITVASVFAQSGTDFLGTVLMVDLAAGKLSVKKIEGGTRFTFVVNDKTQFEGAGLKSLKDVKKGDNVTVNYVVTGAQYIAQKVSKK